MARAAEQYRRFAKQKPVHDRRADFRGRKRFEAKRRIWLRDEGICQHCGRLVSIGESILDHKRALVDGGSHDDWNLQTLCKPCSDKKTAGEQR